VWNYYVCCSEAGVYGANGIRGQDSLNADFVQSVDVGSVVYLVGGYEMAWTVSWEKDDLLVGDFSQKEEWHRSVGCLDMQWF
jgi:hypothetical protein